MEQLRIAFLTRNVPRSYHFFFTMLTAVFLEHQHIEPRPTPLNKALISNKPPEFGDSPLKFLFNSLQGRFLNTFETCIVFIPA